MAVRTERPKLAVPWLDMFFYYRRDALAEVGEKLSTTAPSRVFLVGYHDRGTWHLLPRPLFGLARHPLCALSHMNPGSGRIDVVSCLIPLACFAQGPRESGP
jgi:hypothetical protein